eukprot:12923227-Prorocentrum_lima.AAC.1
MLAHELGIDGNVASTLLEASAAVACVVAAPVVVVVVVVVVVAAAVVVAHAVAGLVDIASAADAVVVLA